ncbi:MAG TPA: hypothetical protein VGN11_03010, partial [Candidatus Baltobacteraceae bacterium]|nr:hypothetical protein [Candidatus Baltobacteraceae bacterium]
MHDLGGLIWVLLVIVGVISSIARSARRNAVAPRRQTWVAPPQVQSQPQIPRPLAPQPTAQPRQLAPKAVLPPVVARGLPDIVAPEPSV